MITMDRCFEFPSNTNIRDSIHINGHNDNMQPLIFHMNYSSMELVLFKKLLNITLSRSVFQVIVLFQFSSTKSSLNILLQYAQNLEENIQTLFATLITNHDNQKTYGAPQWNLTCVFLLTSYSQELSNYRCQMLVLYTQSFNVFNTFFSQNIVALNME